MNPEGFFKINETEFPKSILKKKSQYDQKSKCQTDNIPKQVKTIRFTTEIQKKSKLFSSSHTTLLSNKSKKDKEIKRDEKKRKRSDTQKNIAGKIEEKVENLQKRIEVFKEERSDSQNSNDLNLLRFKKCSEKVITSKQKTEVAVEKQFDENGVENSCIGEEKKVESVKTQKIIMKKNSVDAEIRKNEKSDFLEHKSEERKYVREDVHEISLEEKIVEKKRRKRRKRKRGNKRQLNNSNVFSLS